MKLFLDPATTMNWPQIATLVIGSGGAVGAFAALMKARPEAERVVVSAAEGAVVVQKTVIEGLHAEIERLRKALATESERADRLQAEVDARVHKE